jgi:hypothetical protein
MEETEVVEEETVEDEWRPLLRRELVQTGVAVATYVLIRLAIELADEESKTRWRLRRVWHEMMTAISSDQENKAIATTAARGVEYAQIWLSRQWSGKK